MPHVGTFLGLGGAAIPKPVSNNDNDKDENDDEDDSPDTDDVTTVAATTVPKMVQHGDARENGIATRGGAGKAGRVSLAYKYFIGR